MSVGKGCVVILNHFSRSTVNVKVGLFEIQFLIILSFPLGQSCSYVIKRLPFVKRCALTLNHISMSKFKVKVNLCNKSLNIFALLGPICSDFSKRLPVYKEHEMFLFQMSRSNSCTDLLFLPSPLSVL